MEDDLVKKMAEAIGDNVLDADADSCRYAARAALRAIEEAGYVVLPTTDLDTLRRHNEAAEQRGRSRALGEPK